MRRGTGVSPGIGLAQALLWREPVNCDYIPRTCASADKEIDRFEAARRSMLGHNQHMRDRTALMIGDGEAAIFDAYSMILEDEDGLLEPLRRMIRQEMYSAEYAVLQQFTLIARDFMALDSEYMRQRVDDVFALQDSLMRELMGQPGPDVPRLDRPCILIAKLIAPTDFALLDLSRVEGIICESGGFTSHTAIIARTVGIPAIMAAKGATSVPSGTLVAMDGDTGEFWMDPTHSQVEMLRRRADALAEKKQAVQAFRGLPTISQDGHRIELCAGIAHSEELPAAVKSDAEGLGLFRTELLHVGEPGFPDEEEQFKVYCELLEGMQGKPVCVRTFDDGSNRTGLAEKKNAEMNPVLGYRGIRMSLGRPSFFRTQLRALLRASAFGPLKIMFPMVATVEELDSALHALHTIQAELQRENIPFDPQVKIGLYITIPAAAFLARDFAQKVDFFTVGLNDLTQFLLAVDRDNPDLGDLYHAYHPSVLRILRHIIKAAHMHNIPCNVSGEVPGMESILPVLMGMDVDGLVLNTNLILSSRQKLGSILYTQSREMAEEVLRMSRFTQVYQKIHGVPHPKTNL